MAGLVYHVCFMKKRITTLARTLTVAATAAAFAHSQAGETAMPKFTSVTVDDQIGIGYGVAAVDIDGDGKTDIALADKDQFVWYRNPDWKKFVMTESLTERDHVCIAARDINGDGKAEVAVGAGWNPGDTINSGAVFYLMPTGDRTLVWDPIRLPHVPTTHRMRWIKNSDGQFDLVVLPLHGAGNKGATGDGVQTWAYHMPENPRDPWTMTLVTHAYHKTHNLDPVQWDADTEEEWLLASQEGVWLINPVGPGQKAWMIGGKENGHDDFPGAGEVRNGRLPNGKNYVATIEPMHGNQVVVYRRSNPGSDQPEWIRSVLDDSLVDGHAVACGDFLNLGYDQLVVGWRAMFDRDAKVGIKLFVPTDPDGKEWKSMLVDDDTMACEDLRLADFNGDGWLDIVAAGRATQNVKVYYNQRR